MIIKFIQLYQLYLNLWQVINLHLTHVSLFWFKSTFNLLKINNHNEKRRISSWSCLYIVCMYLSAFVNFNVNFKKYPKLVFAALLNGYMDITWKLPDSTDTRLHFNNNLVFLIRIGPYGRLRDIIGRIVYITLPCMVMICWIQIAMRQ